MSTERTRQENEAQRAASGLSPPASDFSRKKDPPRIVPQAEWPADLQRPEVTGVAVGRCISADLRHTEKFRGCAHAHANRKYPNAGWLCFRRTDQLRNRQLVLHELAHILSGEGHTDRWRKALTALGGQLQTGPGWKNHEKVSRPERSRRAKVKAVIREVWRRVDERTAPRSPERRRAKLPLKRLWAEAREGRLTLKQAEEALTALEVPQP